MIDTYIIGDITDRDAKTFGMFSTRQAVFGGIGVVISLVLFFGVLPEDMVVKEKIIISFLCSLPFFLLTLKIYDMPFEKIVPILVYENFILPMRRDYILDIDKKIVGNSFDNMTSKDKKKVLKKISKDKYKSKYK